MFTRFAVLGGAALLGLAACTQPEPVVIGPQPIADKYGTLYCPDGYVLQGDVCVLPAGVVGQVGVVDGTNGVPGEPGAPGVDDATGNQNRLRNENQNQNQLEETNQAGTG